jgi:two-component system OmpR family response regulator
MAALLFDGSHLALIASPPLGFLNRYVGDPSDAAMSQLAPWLSVSPGSVLMFNQEPARILVVDDEAVIRLTLDLILQRAGYIVTTAANGEEALAWLVQSPFDLLLLDLGLPGISGLNVAHYAQEHHPSTVVLFLTGSSDFANLPIEEQVGHFDYILKTASPQAVVDRVAFALLPEQEVAA